MTKRILPGLVLLLLMYINVSSVSSQADFASLYTVTFGADHVQLAADGSVALTLDQESGSGFASKEMYTYGYISNQIKLVSGNSAGTATAYYVSNAADSSPVQTHHSSNVNRA